MLSVESGSDAFSRFQFPILLTGIGERILSFFRKTFFQGAGIERKRFTTISANRLVFDDKDVLIGQTHELIF